MVRSRSLVMLLISASALSAWAPAITEQAGVRLELAPQPIWDTFAPRPVAVKLTNLQPGAVRGVVALGLIDGWTVVGENPQSFRIAAGEAVTLQFPVIMSPESYAAHYPLHATARFTRGGRESIVHTVQVVEARPPLPAAGVAEPVRLSGRGVLALARLDPTRVLVTPRTGQPTLLPPGVTVDPASRAHFSPGQRITRGGSRDSIAFHPPWAGGVFGTVSGDYRLTLPAGEPIAFESGLAIRDHLPEKEPPSDGVTFRVEVAAEDGFTTVAERHTLAKEWQPLTADLGSYAGQTITLRLTATPGPANNTACDTGYWGGPVIRIGAAPLPEPAVAQTARAERAIALARASAGGQRHSSPLAAAWPTGGEAGTTGAAIVLGPHGLLDARIAVAGGEGTLVFTGFECQVSEADLLDRVDPAQPVTATTGWASWVVDHHARYEGRPLLVRATVRPVQGGLQIAWSMPGVERDRRGHPRYTHLALAAGDLPAHRIYFGHGHVLEGSPGFSFGYSGFTLSTSYVGVEYANGLSLVTATDPVPDRFDHDQARRYTSLVAHHDTTFTLVPSTTGAFAAARQWRRIAALSPAPDVAAIRGKMCLDQWGGDYAEAAEDLRSATAYGLDEAVFVKHMWQRWGYDYRLPDIYPPAGDRAAFDDLAAAAKLNGRLFALHDNYIDYYPDATGFSYDKIAFDENGQPRAGWDNKYRRAQAYTWLPGAFLPVLRENLQQIEQGLDPSAYFIDVWSAATPVDYYDRAGKFYPKMADQRSREEGFEATRELLGAATISETGHDALIGHLASAQADHLVATTEPGHHRVPVSFRVWDRVPWFDMAHHGNFILFAGGLGGRYEADRPTALHGYGSDDYLSLTILGGRTPMCDGPFHRRTVMTYWLLQPICAELERQEMLAHRFLDDDVRHQQVTWSNGQVTVNRADSDLKVGEAVLPPYGFVADAGPHHAEVTRRDGIVSALATSPGLLFADARPPDVYVARSYDIAPEITGFKDLGGRKFQLNMVWRVTEPAPATSRMFIHLTGPPELLPDWQPNWDILFQAQHNLSGAQLNRAGVYPVTATGVLPEKLLPGQLELKYGLYDPTRPEAQLQLRGRRSEDRRYPGGTITVTGAGAATAMRYEPPQVEPADRHDNLARRPVDFGPVVTNTAFRLEHGQGDWRLTLLPGSRAAEVTLRLDRLGAAGRRVAEIERLDLAERGMAPATFRQAGDEVACRTADEAFRYRVRFE